MSSETTWTLADIRHMWEGAHVAGEMAYWDCVKARLEAIATRRSQPEVAPVECEPGCGESDDGSVVDLCSAECAAAGRPLNPADRAKAKDGKPWVAGQWRLIKRPGDDAFSQPLELLVKVGAVWTTRDATGAAFEAREEWESTVLPPTADQPAAPPGFRVVGRSGPGVEATPDRRWRRRPDGPFHRMPVPEADWNAGLYDVAEPIADPPAPVAHAEDCATRLGTSRNCDCWPTDDDENPPTHRCDPRDEATCAGDCADLPPAAPAVPQPGVPDHAGIDGCDHSIGQCAVADGGVAPAPVTPAAVQEPDECRHGNSAHDECPECDQETLSERVRHAVGCGSAQMNPLADEVARMALHLAVKRKVANGFEKQLAARDLRIAELEAGLVDAQELYAGACGEVEELKALVRRRGGKITRLEASSADLVRRAQEAEVRLSQAAAGLAAAAYACERYEQKEKASIAELAELRGKLAAAEAKHGKCENAPCPKCGGGPEGEWFEGSEVKCADCGVELIVATIEECRGRSTFDLVEPEEDEGAPAPEVG